MNKFYSISSSLVHDAEHVPTHNYCNEIFVSIVNFGSVRCSEKLIIIINLHLNITCWISKIISIITFYWKLFLTLKFSRNMVWLEQATKHAIKVDDSDATIRSLTRTVSLIQLGWLLQKVIFQSNISLKWSY